MSIPINIDLVIKCKQEQLFSDQVGGNPDTNLRSINNLVYQCVSSPDNKYTFYYDQTNTHELNNSRYLGKGGNTVVMSIIQSNGIPTLNTKQFVMRVTELTDKFNVTKYIEDKKLVGRYVPEAYYYGILYCDGGVKLNYVIAQKCNIFSQTTINNMVYSHKQSFLSDLLECLSALQKNDYVLWDLKIHNVGYTDDYKCVLIDYDDKTILPTTQWSRVNTYWPTYIYINRISFEGKYEIQTIMNNVKLNKLSVAGLADVILGLFFTVKNNEKILNASLHNLHSGGKFKSSYTNNSSDFHVYSQNTDWWTKSFLNLVSGEKIKEYLFLLSARVGWDIYHTNLINVLFNYDSYTGLLSPEYSKIPTFEEVITMLYGEPIELINHYESMVGGSNIEYKKKYEKYLKLNQSLLK